MPELERLEKQFLSALAELGELLDKIVIVGGWCPFLYAKYLWCRHVPVIPTTLDIDLGVLETGVQHYPATIYETLKNAGFKLERLCPEEEEPIEFISHHGKIDLKLEFITSFLTSDDTLNRFLGKQIACHRLEAFEILLHQPLTLKLKVAANKNLMVHVPDPATFLYHRGISFVLRGDRYKLEKDLFYLYFILKYHPQPAKLLSQLQTFKNHEFFPVFRENLLQYLGHLEQPGYGILRKFLGHALDPRAINKELQTDLAPLLKLLS